MALDTSKFLGGDGTLSNPFIIHDADAFLAIFADQHSDGSAQYKFFEMVADIDISDNTAFQFISTKLTGSSFDGLGHSITFPSLDSFYDSLIDGNSYVKNLSVKLNGGSIKSNFLGDGVLENIYIEGVIDAVNGNVFYEIDISNCLFNASFNNKSNLCSSNVQVNNSYYIEGKTQIKQSNSSYGLVLSSAQYNASSYLNLSLNFWDVEDGVLPQVKIKPYSGFPVSFIKGKTLVDGVPKKRDITAFVGNFTRINTVESDGLTGNFDIQVSPYTTNISIIAFDRLGGEFKTSREYKLGDIAHINPSNGYRYICTTAGTSAATFPNSYPTSSDLTFGTAVFTPQIIDAPSVVTNIQAESII